MSHPPYDPSPLTRRELLRYLALAPLALRAAPLHGLAATSTPAARNAPTSFADPRYLPHYPVRSPLEDVLRLVPPGSDEYISELYAHQLNLLLDTWRAAFLAGDLTPLRSSLTDELLFSSPLPSHTVAQRSGPPITTERCTFDPPRLHGADLLLQQLHQALGSSIQTAAFEITALTPTGTDPLTLDTTIRYSLTLHSANSQQPVSEQRVGLWHLRWAQISPTPTQPWRVVQWAADSETRGRLAGLGFVEVTSHAMRGVPSLDAQLNHGADFWRTVLDGASGIDLYGNNGVAVGDINNDGFDDLYICQPAGLPNRLFRNRGDGTFEDITEHAGVAVLDNTACALFADLRNSGLQDLLVVCGTGPLLFLNNGDSTFTLKPDAFHFAQPPQGTFTSAAIADVDNDGHLDIYFCLYSYYLGLDQYHYPAPYFDARNGPPNFLLHNDGNANFTDRTSAAGLQADNDRYSFACAWGVSSPGKPPDLYVVNDFGRNNLYRNLGNGTFQSAATAAHVEDVGAGMSACWADTTNSSHPDLYVSNMWSAAGLRVSDQPQFHPNTPAATLALYQRHARGNALYQNQGDGTFRNISQQAGVEVGRWAWGSDFLDFDHDGFADLYITNGYITAPEQADAFTTTPHPPDLGSFFWRQVVGRSPNDATPSLAYEHGWNALNELIRSDRSWAGSERNVCLANNHDGTFTELSGPLGLDLLEDGRSFALADIDGDGRLEILVKNRNAPQLSILHNQLTGLGNVIAFRLRGTTSNRDAIGATITLTAGPLVQTRSLQAGSGFLSQHTKQLFFGLGVSSDRVSATVHWPSGLVQHFPSLPPNRIVSLTEADPNPTDHPFPATTSPYATLTAPPPSQPIQQVPLGPTATWLLDPLPAPAFSLPDLNGTPHTLADLRQNRPTVLHLWAAATPASAPDARQHLRLLQQHHAAFAAAGLQLIAININPPAQQPQARDLASALRLPFPTLFSTDETAGVYNIIVRYLFDRRRDLALPTSMLLDASGSIVRLYEGPATPQTLLADARSIPSTPADRTRLALPFPGTLHLGSFQRNDFTYGVAMFQHGYLAEAAESFQQVVTAHPNNAEGFYNLGTLNLRQNNFAEARRFLEHTLQLKPDYPEAWNNLGMMAAQQGNADEAISSFNQALKLRPTYATALLNLGNVLRRQHNFPAAEDALNRALAQQPDDPEALYSLGLLHAQQNDLDQAQQLFQRAIALRPDYPEALNNLGVLYVRENNLDAARQQFETCIRLVPTYEESYLNLARLQLQQGDRTAARATIANLLRAVPTSLSGQRAQQALTPTP